DIGKGSPGFEQRDNATVLVKYLQGAGFDFCVTRAEHHATVSVPVLDKWLQARHFPEATARRIAVAVGGHHGTFPEPGGHDLGADVLGNERWATARQDLLAWLADLLGVPLDRPPTCGDGDDQSYLMVLAGLTAVADWIGSNQTLFPPAGTRDNYLDE